MFLETLKERHLLACLLVHLGSARHFGNAALQDFQIREDQFKIDRLDVTQGVHASVHMDDIAVLEAAHNVNDRVHLADIGEELVAQALPLGSAFDKASDIHKLDDSRRDLFGMVHLAEKPDSFIGNRNNAHVRVDRTERIICRFRACLGKCVKKCALSNIRKTYDT